MDVRIAPNGRDGGRSETSAPIQAACPVVGRSSHIESESRFPLLRRVSVTYGGAVTTVAGYSGPDRRAGNRTPGEERRGGGSTRHHGGRLLLLFAVSLC